MKFKTDPLQTVMKFKTEPLPHQLRAFNTLKDLGVGALLWTMGLGKTKTAIDLAVYKFLKGEITRVLIVAPNTVHTQWVNEQLPLHCGVDYVAHAFSSKRTQTYLRSLDAFIEEADKAAYSKLSFIAVHTNAFSCGSARGVLKEFLIEDQTMFIVDEATRIKNPKSKVTKALLAYRKLYGGPALVMTGTALAKRPTDIWALCEFLDHRLLSCSYTAFEARHTVMQQRTFSAPGARSVTIKTAIDEKGWRICKERLSRTAGTREDIYNVAAKLNISPMDVKFIMDSSAYTKYKGIDRLKEQLKPYTSLIEPGEELKLPPKKYEVVTVPLTETQKSILRDLRKHAIAHNGDHVMSVQNAMALQTRGLQVCGGFFPYNDEDSNVVVEPLPGVNRKLEYLLEDLEEVGSAQFLVFAVFRAELELLTNKLRNQYKVRPLYGSVGKELREQYVKEFKQNEIQGLVCNPSVAGYGLNLQGATVQYWYSRSYRTEDRIQAEGRSHRIGTVESPVYKDIVCECAFEQAVLNNNKEGRSLNEFFNSQTAKDVLEF